MNGNIPPSFLALSLFGITPRQFYEMQKHHQEPDDDEEPEDTPRVKGTLDTAYRFPVFI